MTTNQDKRRSVRIEKTKCCLDNLIPDSTDPQKCGEALNRIREIRLDVALEKTGNGAHPFPVWTRQVRLVSVGVDQLYGESCLIAIRVVLTSLKHASIGKVLPHLGPP